MLSCLALCVTCRAVDLCAALSKPSLSSTIGAVLVRDTTRDQLPTPRILHVNQQAQRNAHLPSTPLVYPSVAMTFATMPATRCRRSTQPFFHENGTVSAALLSSLHCEWWNHGVSERPKIRVPRGCSGWLSQLPMPFVPWVSPATNRLSCLLRPSQSLSQAPAF